MITPYVQTPSIFKTAELEGPRERESGGGGGGRKLRGDKSSSSSKTGLKSVSQTG
jgi:hypothetical protein